MDIDLDLAEGFRAFDIANRQESVNTLERLIKQEVEKNPTFNSTIKAEESEASAMLICNEKAENSKIAHRKSKLQSSSFDGFKMEELECTKCRSTDVLPGNLLVECCNCSSMFHQSCHKPNIEDNEATGKTWKCSQCHEVKYQNGLKKPGIPSISSKPTATTDYKAWNEALDSTKPNQKMINSKPPTCINKKKQFPLLRNFPSTVKSDNKPTIMSCTGSKRLAATAADDMQPARKIINRSNSTSSTSIASTSIRKNNQIRLADGWLDNNNNNNDSPTNIKDTLKDMWMEQHVPKKATNSSRTKFTSHVPPTMPQSKSKKLDQVKKKKSLLAKTSKV